MRVVRCTLIDLLILCADCREDEKVQYAATIGRPYSAEECAADLFGRVRNGVAFTMLDNHDQPLIAGGWTDDGNGVWTAWMVGTDRAWDTKWRSVTKITRKVMKSLFTDGARRLQVNALATRTRTLQWYVRGLKMQPEGVLRGFCSDGSDLALYARLAGD